MQDINNKLTDLLDDMVEVTANETTVFSHLQTIEQKQDTMIELLRTIAANTAK